MLLEKALYTLARHRMLESGDRVVVAVSGGPDSVALCHFLHHHCCELRLQLVIAHVHHGLRGPEADEDVRFVQDLGSSFHLPVVVKHVDVRGWQDAHGGSLPMVARTLRYQCLRRIMEEKEASKLALGHNADDQTEEVLLRLFRGVGPHGLAGMPAVSREGMVRPLLECHRSEIIAYLHTHGLTYRQDASNLKPWCKRNLLRLEFLPRLAREFNCNLNATLSRTTRILQDEENFWESLLQPWLEHHVRRDSSGGIRLPIAPLLDLHPAMQRRLLRRVLEETAGQLSGFGFRHTELLVRLCRSGAAHSEIHLPGGMVAEKSYDWLTITKPRETPDPFYYEIAGTGIHRLPRLDHTLEIQEHRWDGSVAHSEDPFEVLVDRDRLTFPLTLRSARAGDRFQPLGMSGRKKLKDFFVDVKVPRYERRLIPVLCSIDHIVWVIGHRIDDRAKITPETNRLLRLRYRPGSLSRPERK
jgi:tRNA(Ile)-lysidine synthase